MVVAMPEQTIMAFDYGDARLGIAIGNTLLKIAHPLETIKAQGMHPQIDLIEPLIERWRPQVLVVGIPHAHDNPQKIQLINTINNFVKRLGRRTGLPVVTINEDFTSAVASSLLNEQGIYGRAQTGKLDQLAACAILDTYFNT